MPSPYVRADQLYIHFWGAAVAIKWHDLMIGNYYDPHVQMAWAAEWLAEVASATCEARRILCLNEAERCLELVQRSICTPVLLETPHPRLAALSTPMITDASSMPSSPTGSSAAGGSQSALPNRSEMTLKIQSLRATGSSLVPIIASLVPRGP
jgi:hypothetical protein